MTAPQPAPPIRLTILTGFLGAGKTTLLNRLLRDPAVRDTAVVVNEFGEAGIDALLVETTFSDGVVELAGGCVCCSVRGELVDTLLDLATRERPNGERLQRVVLETTGLADPSPVLASMMTHPALLSRYALDGVVTVVDALSGPRNLSERNEARRQVSVADRIVVTKTDLADATAVRTLRAAVAALNPRAVTVDAAALHDIASQLLSCGIVDPATGKADAERWIGPEPCAGQRDNLGHAHHAHARVRSFTLARDEPVAWAAVADFLDLLGGTHGSAILRMKGIVHIEESLDRPIVLHGVGGHLHPPARLAAWPENTPARTRIVLIGDGLPEAACRDLFAAFTGGIRPDAPDRRAIEDNPLAVPGFTFR